ncbi:MAG: LysM repeat protein [Glaciecola sp.]|jgi:LysM repeat protein
MISKITAIFVACIISISALNANLPVMSLYNDSSQWDISDSLMYLPAYDDYCHWEQSSIWGKRENLTKIDNNITIKLIKDSCQFSSPVVGRITSEYGWRKGRPHYGVDVKLYKGDSVRSIFEGVVRIAKYSKSYGYVVVVRHANGLESLYAHLSKLLVKSGDVVDAGTLIGKGGNTGRSFGSHLHLEMRYLGEPFNPAEVFALTDSSFTLKQNELTLNKQSFDLAKKARSIRYHRIRSGDSLWRISKKYHVSIGKLCRLNKMSRKKTLKIGKRLRVN